MASSTVPASGLSLRSTVNKEVTHLELRLIPVDNAPPKDDEVVLRIEASPVNPSDLNVLVGGADIAAATVTPEGTLTMPIPNNFAAVHLGKRAGVPIPAGNEGCGIVVAAGASPAAQALLGKRVAALGGAMYSEYRTYKAQEVMELPTDITPAEGASCFVNPLTALGMVETMRMEGHTAIIHTAAASNLGQMLVKICLADNVPLINVVRSAEHVKLLKDIGATYVIDSSLPNFSDALTDAIEATGATLAFDAIGGGRMANTLLNCMEAAVNRKDPAAVPFLRYGTFTFKQVYIYGVLDARPTEFERAGFGFQFAISGWLLTVLMRKISAERARELKARVVRELKTTFASTYSGEITLQQLLDPTMLAACNKKATGTKYLLVNKQ